MGRGIGTIEHKIAGNRALEDIFREELWKAERVRTLEATGRDAEEDLLTARAGGGVHREMQGAQAGSVRGEGFGGTHGGTRRTGRS